MGRTVLIVDDHAAFRAAARAMLESGGLDVVGEAADGASALAAAAELRPEIVLLDVHLPDVDGFVVAAQLAEAGLSSAVVLTSSRDERSLRRRLATTPSWTFVPKGELAAESLAGLDPGR